VCVCVREREGRLLANKFDNCIKFRLKLGQNSPQTLLQFGSG